MPREKKRKNDPILQIEAVDNPRNADPVVVKLLFDEPLTKKKDKGDMYIYKLEAVENCWCVDDFDDDEPYEVDPGTEIVLFAWSGLYNTIEDVEGGPPGKGDVLEIVRTGEGKKTKWFVELDAVVEKPSKGRKERGADTGSKGKRAKPQEPSQDPSEAFEERVDEYLEALTLARAKLEEREIPYSVDLNAMAYTFYNFADQVDFRFKTPPVSRVKQDDATEPATEPEGDDVQRKMLEKVFRASMLDPKEQWKFLELCHKEVTGNAVAIRKWEQVDAETARAAYGYARGVQQELRRTIQERSEDPDDGPPSDKEMEKIADYEWRQVFEQLDDEEFPPEEDLPF